MAAFSACMRAVVALPGAYVPTRAEPLLPSPHSLPGSTRWKEGRKDGALIASPLHRRCLPLPAFLRLPFASPRLPPAYLPFATLYRASLASHTRARFRSVGLRCSARCRAHVALRTLLLYILRVWHTSGRHWHPHALRHAHMVAPLPGRTGRRGDNCACRSAVLGSFAAA